MNPQYITKHSAIDPQIGALPVVLEITVPDGTGDTDIVLDFPYRVLDAWGRNTGIAAHATDDTWQLKNGASAISDAVAKTATVDGVKRVGSLADAYVDIAAGGTLRVSAVKATNSAVKVYVMLVRNDLE